MAQRQFRSDDTSKWLNGFGSGTAGSTTISGTFGSGTGGWIGAASGTAGATTLTVTSSWTGAFPCVIHQSREGGSGVGNWELNYILSMSSGTATLRYPLIYSYGTTAQCILMVQYIDLTVGNIVVPAWDGSAGGIMALMASNNLSVTGVINATGRGYRGQNSGILGDDSTGKQGEGSGGAGGTSQAANGNGGGANTKRVGAYPSGGAGGGNASAGEDGQISYPNTYRYAGGTGGTAVGAASLTTMFFGGAGGEMNSGSYASVAYSGGNGGGIIMLIGKTVTVSGQIATGGVSGTSHAPESGASGSGAGGSVLIKGSTVTLGGGLVTASGAARVSAGAYGGAGSNGRIHVDYGLSISGSTTPTLDATNDVTITQPLLSGGMI